MAPWEVMISESQERMVAVVEPERLGEVRAACDRWELPCTVIGEVTGHGELHALVDDETVGCIPAHLLTEACPRYELEVQERATAPAEAAPVNCEPKEWVYEQYDQLVGSRTLRRPGLDAAVLRLDGTRGLAVSLDGPPLGCRNPVEAGFRAVLDAALNVACAGGEPLALTDCLNFGNPERPEIMWEFQQAIAGIRDACTALGTPVVSGNVSFYNETEGRNIPPTPTIAMVGLLEDVDLFLTPWWKAEGDVIVLLGRTREELGASEYLAVVHGVQRGAPPWIDLETEKRLHSLCLTAAHERLLRSAHDVGAGGLAVALAECCFAGPGLGARIALERGIRTDALLFGESQSRMLVSLRRRHLGRFRDLARREGVPFTFLGAFETQGAKQVFYLVEGDKVHAVTEGEIVNEIYQVEAVTAEEMVLVYLPLKIRQTLALGGNK